jgi:cellulose biosynthesis protein BcsQ
MKTVCFFNNKAGVGKTTLICNIAANFVQKFNKRILLIDCDPQCNATQLILGDDNLASLYLPDKAAFNKRHTIFDVIAPIQDGDATINLDITPSPGAKNRFGVDILPGHPRFSAIEAPLSQAWYEAIGGDIEGLRKTNWCSVLYESFVKDYDIIFVDLGTEFSSINRTVLLGSDFFVCPVGWNVMSVVGIQYVADWLHQSIHLYEKGLERCESRNPGQLASYNVKYMIDIAKGFAGYTLQQYIFKSKESFRSRMQAFEPILNRIPDEIQNYFSDFFAKDVTLETAKLGDVPYLFSLIPLGLAANAPIFDLSPDDRIVGSEYFQVEEYTVLVNALSKAIARNIGVEI